MALIHSLSLVPSPRPEPRGEVAPVVPAPAPEADALIASYRLHGHRVAAIDPLGDSQDPFGVAELDPRHHALAIDDSVVFRVELGGAVEDLPLSRLLERLRASYCGSIALDCAHVRSDEQRRWLYARMESMGARPPAGAAEAKQLLQQLIAVEAFEHRRLAHYPQYKQFNLEGGESFVPLLRALIEEAAREGAESVVLAMPHRGRLNAMLNALDVPAERLLTLLSPEPDPALAARDLRDHAGLSSRMRTRHGEVGIELLHNPSHLESVVPVACGVARALQDRKAGSVRKVLPVLVHGDGSFCGQGVVAETFNLSQTRGYAIGGTVHLILNNQIGSTISHPRDQRSTLYCADLARAYDAPIVRVNADDPEASLAVARVAAEFRMRFGADIVVDHVGYRRYGHWVGDDPTMTRPAMQRRIDARPAVAKLYAAALARRGVADENEVQLLYAAALHALEAAQTRSARMDSLDSDGDDRGEAGPPPSIHTALPIDRLRALAGRLATSPEGFAVHPAVERMREDWRAVANGDDRAIDWRLGESLAYAALLANGFNVRLTGLDVGRGSFCHRQHVWHDQGADVDGRNDHVPLRGVARGQGSFSIFESPLSEEAVLGFEYGYSIACGRDLVVWEGQFGDFVNNAQVVIDQFVASGEAKWGYESGLTMLLPHGDDGLGPEHSNAYLGRFLQLCAQGNIEVAIPSTPAQLYHVLRRQALRGKRKPLIVMTPKPWLYAHAASYSRLADLANGEFLPLLVESAPIDAAAVRRAVVVSGKFYYALATERARAGARDLPIVRAEALYPFPAAELEEQLARFPGLAQVVWAQEEAKNHGAWYMVREPLESALPAGASLVYAGRPPRAAAASADAAGHAAEQERIARAALALDA